MPDSPYQPDADTDSELRLTYAMLQYEWYMTICTASGQPFDGIAILRSLLAGHGFALMDLGRPEAMQPGHYTTLGDEEIGKLSDNAARARAERS